LKQVVANLEDYKPVKEAAVPFAFNKDMLSAEAKQQLDELVGDKSTLKQHYFIAVEGFTDLTGSAEYNAALSRRRADRVVQYLVAQHDIPIYRVHMVGLGAQKPAEDARNRAANAKNRRVEVTIYSADPNAAAITPSATNR
jgi:outer membrane protein OmpA-like peptidoglycan-associated protein